MHSHSSAEIVFGLEDPVPAGTEIREAGPPRPDSSSSPEKLVARTRGSAWLFYEDLAPFEQYAHSGRVALVDVRTGRASVSRLLTWPPLVNGRLPAFLRSWTAHDSGTDRVFYRPYAGGAAPTTRDHAPVAARAARDARAALDPSLAARVGRLLAAEHACMVRFSDTVHGGFYAFARVAQSRAALAYRFDQLSRAAPGLRSFNYSRGSGLSPTAFVARLAARGCQDVMLYLAGGGYRGTTAVNIGLGLQKGKVRHQDVTLGDLRRLIAGHPGVRFELVLDAPYASGFQALARLGNVLLVATPVAPGGGSFAYLSDAAAGGRLIRNDSNPLRLLQLTDRLAFGLTSVIDDQGQVSQLESLTRAGAVTSPLAYLLARGFDEGAPVDFAAWTGVGSAPRVYAKKPSGGSGGSGGSGPPSPPTVTANPDSYATTSDTALSAPAPGVLANDTDRAHHPLFVDQLNGAGGTPPLHGTSAEGAAITMNANGSFNYDPTGSAALQSLGAGQSTSDTFTYRADNGHNGTSTATVTIRVTAGNQPPALSGIESSALQYDAGTPAAPVTSTLAVGDPDDANLAGATVKISSGLVASEDSLSFANQNGISGSYNAGTGVLTLTGASSLAHYQAALRSVRFHDSNGVSPTTGTRTISFQADDGHSAHNLSNVVSRDVTVNPNPPPTAADDSASTDKATAIDIPVLANDGDPDGDTLSVASVDTTGTKGSVSVNPDGTIHYDPNGQFNSLQAGQTATDTFSYRASDGFHDSGSATVTVTIEGSNAPPVLSGIESSTLQYDAGTPAVAITSSLTVSDIDDTTLAGATVKISSGFVSSEDALLFTNQNGITGSFDSTTGVLTLTGTATLADYQTALRSVTFADSNGSNPTTGTRTISFQADDGHASNNLSNIATRNVSVNPNPAPTAVDDSASTGKHAAIDIPVLANDSDSDGDALSVASVDTTGTKGSVSVNPDGTIHYDPNGQFDSLQQGQTATDTFSYKASDGFHDSSSATVTVTIDGSNDAPVLAGIESSALSYRASDPAVAVTSSLTVSDDDDPTLSGAQVSISAGFSSGADTLSFTDQNGITGSYDSSTGVLTLSGTATIADYQTALRSVQFSTTDTSSSPAARTISLTATDPEGATSNTAQRQIDVSPSHEAPVLSGIESSALTYRAQDPAVAITSTLTVSDATDTSLTGATVSITSGFSSANDSLSFTDQNGITGSYNATTGVLTLSGTSSVANYQTALRSVQFSTSDSSASPAARTISFAATNPESETSNTATRDIDVTEANQPPSPGTDSYNAVGNTPLAVGTTVSGPAVTVSGGSVLSNDSDPDSASPLTVTGNTTPAHGSVSINADGTFTYTPNAGFSGSDSFQYTVTDSDDSGNPKSSTGTVDITVGTVVWYVDNSKASAGDGRAGTPFNTLAAANAAAGTNSVVFLYQGSGNYTGGVSMKTGEALFGQPHGLTVSGHSLVAAGGSTPTITNSGGDGIDLASSADVEGVNVSSPSGNGIAASAVGTATVGGSGGTAVAVSGAGGDGIHVSGGTGTLDFTNASVTGSTGHSLSVSGRTGGTATFGGNISDTGTGISLSSNTGATINLSGKLTVSTGANSAFSATGGGTVTATGSGSTLTTTTGTALNVSSTTIGSGGLTFQSISSNGATNGINLSSTGSSGGLTVTGTGSAASGGTIQASTGPNVLLSSTTNPSFTDMVIENGPEGIKGTSVNGFTLAGSSVSGNGGATTSGFDQDGLNFADGSPSLTGTVSITNSTITGSTDNNAVITDGSGTLNLTITGSTFSSTSSSTGNDGLHVDANGTTNATISVTGSTFTNSRGDHFQFSTDSTSSGTNSVTFSNNTLSTTVSGELGGGVTISPFGNSKNTITVDSNNIQGAVDNGIGIDESGTSGTLSGHVDGNTIGTPATANSGGGNSIGISAEGSGTETLAVTNNTLSQYSNGAGITSLNREGSPTQNLTISGNTISHPGSFGSWGINLVAGATSGPPIDGGTTCAAFGANSITGSAAAGQGGADVELDQDFDANFKLPGYSGGLTDTSAVQTYLQGKIAGSPSALATASNTGSGDGFQGATSCPTPS